MASSLPHAVATSLGILRFSQRMAGREVVPMDEIATKTVACFTEAKADWCVVGAHAMNLYVEPRATTDLDFVLEEKKLRQVLDALERDLGSLEADDIGAAVRLRRINVDLIKSSSSPLFREALARAEEREGWRVPPVEVLVALKFFSAVSPWRGRDRRGQDALDLVRLIHSVDPDRLDRDLMRRLAGHAYPGAEREFDALLGRIERGEPIAI